MINPKEWHVHVDNFRIVPRLLVLGYSYMVYQISEWFMSLPDPTSQQAAFVSTVFAASAAVFGLYTNSGNKNKE